VDADLALFAHVVGRPEADIDLARAALLVAEPEYPELDIPHYIAVLDQLGLRARSQLGGNGPGIEAARGLLALLYEDIGFVGNMTDYYDPRNSFLNEVLDRRTGIPITLAVILIEVAQRAGITTQGVGFPGHFLVRMPVEGGIIVMDPFHGRLLDADDLRELLERVGAAARAAEPHLLAPATKQQILFRMLGNLRGIYRDKSETERLRAVLERMLVLEPSDVELRKELEAIGGEAPPRPSGGGVIN